MKKYLFSLVLIASSCAFGQNTNHFGAPSGACTLGPQTVTDISVTPAQMYVCAGTDGHTWSAVGSSGSGNPVSGATAEYQFLSTETGNFAKDYVGSNSCVFGATTQAPTRTAYGLGFTWASKQYCDTGIAIGSAVTISAVVQVPVSYANGFAGGYSAYFGSSAGNVGLFQATATSNNLGYPTGWGFNFVGTTSSNGFSVITWVRNSTGDKVYINGVPVASNVTAGGSIALGTGTLQLGTIGASCDIGRCAFDGTMLWTDIYPSALSDVQVAQLAAFEKSSVLVGKGYTPTISLPTANAIVHCDGDSITFGQGAVPYCSYLTLNQTSTIDNTGYSGWTMHNMFTGEDRILGAYPPNATAATDIIFGGTNDSSTLTAAQTAGYLSAYIRKASAVGWKVFVVTMLDRGATIGPITTFKNAYNTLIRADWKAWGAAGIIDMAAIPTLGADGAAAGAAFQADHIHPTSASQQGPMATAASEALNYYYGSSESSPNIYTSTSQTLTAADGNVVWTPTGAATGTLPECLGLTGAGFRITNGSTTNAITMSAAGSETITGSATIAANASAIFRVMLTGPTTGGCYWVRQ